MKKILVTGSAGFIGSELTLELLKKNFTVIGLDNHNPYYDPALKEARLSRHIDHENYFHIRVDLEDRERILNIFQENHFDYVVNLAAQAGVRYSIENPFAYIDSNIVGFANILEGCRHSNVKHLVYASSSSVYGSNTKMPFSVEDSVDHPLSFYAATKKANELMAHAYSHLYDLPTTGLRFFTVYGPWGRPDMALYKFTTAIVSGQPIEVYNYGKHKRDFTYIDDIVEGVMLTIENPPKSNPEWRADGSSLGTSSSPWRIFNIGNNNPVDLMDYINAIEESLGIRAEKIMLPLQPGDVEDTYADVTALVDEFNYQPNTPVKEGVKKFISWYKEFHNIP